MGHWQIGSIAVRVLDFEDKAVDGAYWEDRLRVAYDLRCAIGVAGHEKGNDTYRLVHGEGDCLPAGVDVYGKTAVMQAHSVGMHVARHEIARALVAVTGGTVENVYYKSETTLPFKAELGQETVLSWVEARKRSGRERLEVSYRLVERPEDRILRRPT